VEKLLAALQDATIATRAMSASWSRSAPDGTEARGTGVLEGTIAARACRRTKLRLRPDLHPARRDAHRRGARRRVEGAALAPRAGRARPTRHTFVGWLPNHRRAWRSRRRDRLSADPRHASVTVAATGSTRSEGERRGGRATSSPPRRARSRSPSVEPDEQDRRPERASAGRVVLRDVHVDGQQLKTSPRGSPLP